MEEVPNYTSRDLLKFERMSEEELAQHPGAKEQLEEMQKKVRSVGEALTEKVNSISLVKGKTFSMGTPLQTFDSLQVKTVQLHPDSIEALAKAIAEELKK